MPLIKKQRLDEGTWLALWQMTEALEQLPAPAHVDLSAFHSPRRKRETLTEYLLLKELTEAFKELTDDLKEPTGDPRLVIRHNEDGAPLVDGYHISLSHTEGWAAMILSETHKVGVDIEYVSERVNRVASRFIRRDEQQSTLAERLIAWCAKEAVYKFFTEQHLEFDEMRLLPYSPQETGEVTVENLRQQVRVAVAYEVNDRYVLAYVKG